LVLYHLENSAVTRKHPEFTPEYRIILVGLKTLYGEIIINKLTNVIQQNITVIIFYNLHYYINYNITIIFIIFYNY